MNTVECKHTRTCIYIYIYIFAGPRFLEEDGYRRCKFEFDRSCGICRPFQRQGRYVRLICRALNLVTATSSDCGGLMKFDEQLGPRRFSFSTSLN